MSSSLFPSISSLPAGTVVSALMAIQMKNLDALVAVQKMAMEGLGALARQQQEMLAARLTQAAALPDTLTEADPRIVLARPFDAVKTAILDGTAQANLLGELAARSGAEVAGLLQERFLSALDEAKAALLQAVPATRD
ncbi:phasin family protein [Roseicella aerolata]|uniref:Phasin family protein n=1 Tax=Roseicella aerolata TaxID=2883479 RepID=A0A9X1LD88_9PROT|nr:phasin family protein [Roseicella aerolata]MCB4824452.1 phasin family protein [Roseicella aerolata]